ncbi:MAG TPA: lipoprotein [Phycisphaerae bacterium]|nr:lipoprotein [Phycisphaerae bacterium]
MKRIIVVTLLLAALTGCTRPATETRFLLADARISSTYLLLAHPGAVAQARAAGDEQLIADLNALAVEIQANNAHEVSMAQGNVEAAEMALEAILVTNAVLSEISRKGVIPSE